MGMTTVVLTLGVRLAGFIAMGMAWGVIPPIAAFTSLAATSYIIKTSSYFRTTGKDIFRIAIELVVLAFSLIAANEVWGAVWAATMLIVYILGFVARD